MMRSAFVAPSLIALLLAAAGPASAADWASEGLITSPGQIANELSAAVDGNGNQLYVWRGVPRTTPFPQSDILYRTRARGGAFGDIVTLPAATEQQPMLAGAANGDAVIAWSERPAALKLAVRSSGGGFREPQLLFDGSAPQGICWLNTAISSGGEAIVVFGVTSNVSSGTPCRLYAAARRAGSDHFDDPVQLDAAGASYLPQIALDAHGNGVIAWRGDGTTTVKLARHPAGGGFEQTPDAAVDGETVPPDGGPLVLRVSPDGRILLGFPSSGGGHVHVAAAIGNTTTGLGSAEVISGPADLSSGQLGSYFDGGAGADGTLALTWRSSGRGHTRTQAAVIGPDDSGFTSEKTQSVSGYSIQSPQLVVTDKGRVTVMWLRLIGNGARAVEVASGDGGKFGSPQRLASTGISVRPSPVIAVSSTGEQYIAWNTTDPHAPARFSVIQSAKASSRTGRFGSVLDVLRARADINEHAADVQLYPGANGGMLAAVRRDRGNPNERFFSGVPWAWDLRSYAESR